MLGTAWLEVDSSLWLKKAKVDSEKGKAPQTAGPRPAELGPPNTGGRPRRAVGALHTRQLPLALVCGRPKFLISAYLVVL